MLFIMLKKDLHFGLEFLAEKDSKFARALAEVGMPEVRHNKPGFASMLRIIIGQQVSVAAANSIEGRLKERFPSLSPEDFVGVSDDELRGLGLSYQKVSYVRCLSEVILSGDFDIVGLDKLSDDDVISSIMGLRGFGRWSAENYCLFCLGRGDLFPVDDLGLQNGLQIYRGLRERPSGEVVGKYVRRWRPYRSAAAIFIWHYFGVKLKEAREKDKKV